MRWVYNSWAVGYSESVMELGAKMLQYRPETITIDHLPVDFEAFSRSHDNFMERLATIDETLLQHYEPNSKNSLHYSSTQDKKETSSLRFIFFFGGGGGGII